MRTLKQMQVTSVAIYAEADRQSLHVRDADQAVSLGDGNAGETYLDGERILQIALKLGVDAIHPGYGFLSENSEFVRRCETAGIAFIGPEADHIDAFGLKHRARELAQQNNVPLLPGSGILKNSEDALVKSAEIGFPLMLKSSAGGGGIGMQLCRNVEHLKEHYESVSRLSQSNFANSDLFLEKFVERARHIEVQIFGNGHGDVIALGERDCSAQRRNQKVLEETPAPNLTEDTRKQLQELSCQLTAAIDYRSAGTVEFIVDADTEQFYFLEVNTRLQVEHGVTEMVYDVDLVRWMVELASGFDPLPDSVPKPRGHAIQARVYAEDPARSFQPSSGLISLLKLPNPDSRSRIDHWIESGTRVSPFYDPMLAKVITHSSHRTEALQGLHNQLGQFKVYGVETNIDYLQRLLESDAFASGRCLTSTLGQFHYPDQRIEILQPGTLTTVQDYPGRTGYWPVGIPPSGPFDDVSFRLGNKLLGNLESAAGLEMTLKGATLKFSLDIRAVITGARMSASLDGEPVPNYAVLSISAGQTLVLGGIEGNGLRSYLLVEGGLSCPEYLGSRSTFTLGQFGGHCGRALRSGDVLRTNNERNPEAREQDSDENCASALPLPDWHNLASNHWRIHVIPGPQGTNEFFTDEYLLTFYRSTWSVHFNSSRTGIRLVGPQPEWSRTDGGEAGMHPSNLHDNAYAFGTVDFTGDMPVILGPDGPSLGGFVCPATVASADRWKLGQLKAGDTLQLVPVSRDSALIQLKAQSDAIEQLAPLPILWQEPASLEPFSTEFTITTKGADKLKSKSSNPDERNELVLPVKIRRAGDSWLLVEFGDMVLDIELRFVAQRLVDVLQKEALAGVIELTPGIRSLQIHFNARLVSEDELIQKVKSICYSLLHDGNTKVPSRIVHLPLSWDDEQCRIATEKYDQVVRKDAPWYPSNIEFIRRINGLTSVDEVKHIVFDAHYLVLGLGDVYLGAPVATPIDPRHRLVTTKYNPARTWTAENSVGIGGSYLCVYGMEGPGGYQFVGRTLQMWNIYRETHEFDKPWLLRFFDQIKFYPVSGDELLQLRDAFPLGQHALKIEETEFDLNEYRQFLETNKESIESFTASRQLAFNTELEQWKATGQFQFEDKQASNTLVQTEPEDGLLAVECPAAGSIWEVLVKVGDTVSEDQAVMILESMKMEIPVQAGVSGTVEKLLIKPGAMVEAGSRLILVSEENNA